MRTIILFSTKGCGYCKPIKVILEDLKSDYQDNNDVEIMTAEIDSSATALELAKKYGVRAVPTVLTLEKGEVADFAVGQQITRDYLIGALEGDLARNLNDKAENACGV